MASDRGQNRYSHFMATQALLRFDNCSSSYCLLSSWRRVPRSFNRTLLFGAPLALLRVVKFFFRHILFPEATQWACFVVQSLSCPCVFGSSFRRLRYLYKTAIRQLFPPSLHEAHTGQNNTVKKVTEGVSILKDALAKIENKSDEQQPSTPKGGFRGWPRGPRPHLFLWNFVLFL